MYTDDDVLAWWESYEDGLTLEAVALKHGASTPTVQKRLREIGVEMRSRGSYKRGHSRDAKVERPQQGYERTFGWAQAMEDVLPDLARIRDQKNAPVLYGYIHTVRYGARLHLCQSRRERKQAASARPWRGIIRRDLRNAGLLP